MMTRTLQSAGLGFLLVPINTVAFLTLPRELNNDGAALFAMFRNVFGSIGISLGTAAIAQRTRVHQAYLSQWTAPLHQPFETLIATYEQACGQWGGPEPRSATMPSVKYIKYSGCRPPYSPMRISSCTLRLSL
jgi:DHA2 family multidrug resistance protein